LTIADVVKKICTLMGKDFENATTTVGERLGQDSRYWLDFSRAERELNWKPEVQFDDGLIEVIEWVNQNWAEIVKQPLEYIHKV